MSSSTLSPVPTYLPKGYLVDQLRAAQQEGRISHEVLSRVADLDPDARSLSELDAASFEVVARKAWSGRHDELRKLYSFIALRDAVVAARAVLGRDLG